MHPISVSNFSPHAAADRIPSTEGSVTRSTWGQGNLAETRSPRNATQFRRTGQGAGWLQLNDEIEGALACDVYMSVLGPIGSLAVDQSVIVERWTIPAWRMKIRRTTAEACPTSAWQTGYDLAAETAAENWRTRRSDSSLFTLAVARRRRSRLSSVFRCEIT